MSKFLNNKAAISVNITNQYLAMQKYILVGLAILTMVSCIEIPNKYQKLPPGEWRAILKLSDQPVSTGADGFIESDQKLLDYLELPFNFEVSYDEKGKMQMLIKNADERIVIDELKYGRDPATAKDTLEIRFDDFDSYIEAFYEENFIEGFWKVPYRGQNYQIPFLAKYGDSYRFESHNEEDAYNFDGQWKVEFAFDTEDAWPAVAEFKQEGSHISGTFMTETGDYRFLEGQVNNDKMQLSVFDGAHAFLFTCISFNDTLIGEFRSGSHYKTSWRAVRDDDFQLTDAYALTKAVNDQAVQFSFENLDGQIVNIDDPKYNDKIKLVNIMGSWCPNCKDEIHFLQDFSKQEPEIEIISIAFEKYKEKQKSIDVLKRYKSKMGITWPLLYGGYANKSETTETLGFLDKIISYPTLVILDQNNHVVDVQTGFYGPATSQYEAYKSRFYGIIEQLKKQ